MKQLIASLLLGALFGVTLPMVSAQEEQSPQHLAQEIETLKQRIAELEKKLQTVESVEKLELQAKLADANTKLANVQFDKFKQDLRVDNDYRMRGWSYWFFSILAIFVVISGAAIGFLLKSLIANSIEKNLDGFNQGLEEVETQKNEIGVIKNQQRALEREYTVAILDDCLGYTLWYLEEHPEQIKGLGEEALLDVFGDKGRIQAIRYKAAEVLVARRSPRLVPLTLEHLNSVLDSDADIDFEAKRALRNLIIFLERMCTSEAYHGLRKFLNRFITESPQHKDTFLMVTVLAFGEVGIELNMRDSVSILKEVIPYLKEAQLENKNLIQLARYFDRFNEASGIKEILTSHVASGRSEVEEKCLDLLKKYDPKFVQEWQVRKTREQLLTQANEFNDETPNNTES